MWLIDWQHRWERHWPKAKDLRVKLGTSQKTAAWRDLVKRLMKRVWNNLHTNLKQGCIQAQLSASLRLKINQSTAFALECTRHTRWASPQKVLHTHPRQNGLNEQESGLWPRSVLTWRLPLPVQMSVWRRTWRWPTASATCSSSRSSAGKTWAAAATSAWRTCSTPRPPSRYQKRLGGRVQMIKSTNGYFCQSIYLTNRFGSKIFHMIIFIFEELQIKQMQFLSKSPRWR